MIIKARSFVATRYSCDVTYNFISRYCQQMVTGEPKGRIRLETDRFSARLDSY